MNTQQLVMQELEERLKASDLKVTIDQEWANTGEIRTYRGLTLVANLKYNFQSGSIRFGHSANEPYAVYYHGRTTTTDILVPSLEALIEKVGYYLAGED